MGFEIDDIIGNSETTQKFMRLVMEILEEEEHIDMENISPIVKAELLQDHSMTITFGGDMDFPPQTLLETMRRLLESFASGAATEIPDNSLLGDMLKEAAGDNADSKTDKSDDSDDNSMICALEFAGMNELLGMVRVCFGDKLPVSALYKLDDKYYLILDFDGWKKDELRTFVFGTVEYDQAHFSELSRITYIMEHGKCINDGRALEMLRQL
jgi:adapter protein MecA 1/2